MNVVAIKCNECGDIIYSRCLSDRRFCGCGKLIVSDGHKDPFISGTNIVRRDSYDIIDIEVNADEQELLNDYLMGNNEFGVMPANGKTKFMQLEKID